jgi:hypothetical protein
LLCMMIAADLEDSCPVQDMPSSHAVVFLSTAKQHSLQNKRSFTVSVVSHGPS